MKFIVKPVVLVLMMTGSSMAMATESTQSAPKWQPVASETLVRLPANIIEKRIDKDFRSSPMSARLLDVNEQMSQKTARIGALKRDMEHASAEQIQDIKYELIQEKSAYLDLLHESHDLRIDMAQKKQSVYQDLLQRMRNQFGEVSASEHYKIKEKQAKARERMEKMKNRVDNSLLHERVSGSSQYSDEYAANLAQIDKLKSAIATRNSSLTPTIDGKEITSEEYIRQLLLNSAQEHALLDQEGLILSYMSQLVALDAQALEYEIAYGDSDEDSGFGSHTRTAVDAIL